MRKTLFELAKLVGGRLEGSPQIVITGVAGIESARASDITFLDSARMAAHLQKTRAGAIVINESLGLKPAISAIYVADADRAFSRIAALVLQEREAAPAGIHRTAIVSPKARIGKGASVGAFTVVEDGAEIGENSVVGPLCYVGRDVRIGAGCRLHSHVAVRDRCEIGDRCILHNGAVIGADGFGYSKVDGHYEKIPQVGIVVLEEDVEVGANATIDRARLDRTVVGRGTKIDNLVMVGHSVRIGQDCVLAGQAGIAGSCVLGNRVVMAGQTGIADHVTIGDDVVLTAQTGVSKNLPDRGVYSGAPAREHSRQLKAIAAGVKVPELLKEVAALRRRMEELEARLGGR
jgi:UDP-3-O-[3-hydroxymyristoyl] glucosamine N-acyltransferase